MDKLYKKQLAKYKKEQLGKLNNVIEHLVKTHGYINRTMYSTGSKDIRFYNLLDGYNNNKSIGYELDKNGNPLLDKGSNRITLHGCYSETFVVNLLNEFEVALDIIETHLGDLVYVRLEPSETEWRKIKIDEFLSKKNGK